MSVVGETLAVAVAVGGGVGVVDEGAPETSAMGEDSVMDGEGVVKDQDGGGVLEKL